jgi:hypothetical protein
MNKPRNVTGVEFFEMEKIEVVEWHSLPDGEGNPEQVHLWFEIQGWPHPCVIRFRSRRTLDELITNLIHHSKSVWPDGD